MMRVAQTLEHLERADGLRHTLRLEEAVPVHILPQTHALLELVLDHKVISEQPDDDKACGIGAQIDDTDPLRCPFLYFGRCLFHIRSRPFA